METPFGSQNYRKNPDGTTTMVTDVGPEGRELVGRAVGLGMTDSNRMQAPGQLGNMAGALASRVGQRLGLDMGNMPIQIGQQPAMPQAKPAPQQGMPQPQLPSVPPGVTPPRMPPGGGHLRDQWQQDFIRQQLP